MYAIIETGGKQYKVSEGDIITVEKLGVEAGSEYTFENDPSTESTEYYIEFKCSNKSMSDEIVKINWRKDDAEVTKKKMPFTPVSKNHISYSLFKEFCK